LNPTRNRSASVPLGLVLVLQLGVLAPLLSSPVIASASTPATLYAWGQNLYGEVGDGTTTERNTPEAITLAPGVTPTAIAGGDFLSLAIGSDGKLYTWGFNDDGQLGDGTYTNRSTPAAITLAAGVTPTAIAAGAFFGLAIGSDSNLYAWGDGYTDSPEVVTLATGVTPTAISAGGQSAMAIGSDGNLYTWGRNGNGQLGDGSTADRSTPAAITLPSGATPTVIASGIDFSLAIGSDGKLYDWGDNSDGQLGCGMFCSSTNVLTPQAVTLASGVGPTALSAGIDQVLAIGSDGNLYTWGGNDYGDVGDGGGSEQKAPAVVNLASGVDPTVVSARGYSSFAIGSDGNLYAWGNNTYGELGDGTTTDRNSPEAVTLASGVTPTAIAGEDFDVLVIGSTSPPSSLPEAPWPIALPATGALGAATAWWRRSRRRRAELAPG